MPKDNKIKTSNIFPCGNTRREFVWEMGAGFSGIALTSLLSADGFFSRHTQRQLSKIHKTLLNLVIQIISEKQSIAFS